MFLGVVLAFPDGLAGLYANKLKPWWVRRRSRQIAEPRPEPQTGTAWRAS
jgi:urea transport system permease protein